jgi:leucine dehydrogenase
MAREGFEELIALHDRRSGLRGLLAIHDTSQGPAFGGIRRLAYRDESQAMADALRLARAMSHKCALMDLPAGGGKLVLFDRSDTDWRAAYEYIGDVVERLGGRFYTGPDVGTGATELAWASSRTSFVTDPGTNGPGALAESTAEGVFSGMAVALEHLDGEQNWPDRTVVVQGLGSVGALLARRLVGQGAKVLGAEIDSERAESVAEELGIELLEPGRAIGAPCDVFAPCALGGILHDLTLGRLRCRVVAGGANNVLARTAHAEHLHERGILYVPDSLLNCGALIRGTIFHLEGRREPVSTIGKRVGAVVSRILQRAESEDALPLRVAVREAEERIAAWHSE